MSLFGGLARVAASLGGPSKSTGARLLERLGSTTQLEDRREAISEFRDLTAAEPVRLIERGGISVLVALLREDDAQLRRDVLETLSNLFDQELPRDSLEMAELKACHNTSVFVRTERNVGALIDASDDDDLYVRFHAVQALMKLLSLERRPTQRAVLGQPACVPKLMGLLNDRRDVLRNEVLLLLPALGEGDTGLQTLIAFEGAFEQLFHIVEAEAKEHGGPHTVIVHDCERRAHSRPACPSSADPLRAD